MRAHHHHGARPLFDFGLSQLAVPAVLCYREMTGAIPTEPLSKGLAGALGLEAEGGSAHAMLAQVGAG